MFSFGDTIEIKNIIAKKGVDNEYSEKYKIERGVVKQRLSLFYQAVSRN